MAKKINLLHIDTEKSWRGGQQQVYYLHKGLLVKGIESTILGNKDSEIVERCRVEKLPCIELSMRGELDIIAAYKISKIITENNITIIQAHTAHALTLGLLAKIFVPSTILIGVRRVDFSIGKNFLSRIKYTSKKIDKIVCISEFIKSVLISDGINPSKLSTIRSGADISKFNDVIPKLDFRKSIGVSQKDILLGTVAALAGHKDYPNLLEAFSIVKKKIENIKLCIVGDGPLKEEVETKISNLNLNESIILTGFVNNVGNYLKSFDIFVLASRKEGLGTSIIDALAIGLPVVATKTGGIPELITDNVNGILVDPKMPERLAEAIIKLVENRSIREKLAKEAKISAANYSIDETIKQNINEYSKLTKN